MHHEQGFTGHVHSVYFRDLDALAGILKVYLSEAFSI